MSREMTTRLHFLIEARCFLTPKDLRRMADAMEHSWEVTQAGGSLEVDQWSGKEGVVTFVIDQEKMFKEYGPSGQRRPELMQCKDGTVIHDGKEF